MIDWGLAQRVGAFVAQDRGRPPLPGDLAAIADESARRVSAYTGLRSSGPLPPTESLGRREWVMANLSTLRPLLTPVAERLGEGMGPVGDALRTGGGMLIGAEAGLVLGLMSQRVLGQYELALLEPDAPARLMLVAPNVAEAIQSFDADGEEFLTWVVLHEVTHALQFEGVPWLREYLAGQIRRLLETAQVRVDAAALLRLPTMDDLRKFVDTVRHGDLIDLVAGGEERELLERLQSAMAVIEGYAEHVMDAVGGEMLPSLPKMREAMERRRASRGGLTRLIGRLIGIEVKLRQYEVGKRFCDRVVEEAGLPALNRVWESPDQLPDQAELADPGRWITRTAVPAVTKS